MFFFFKGINFDTKQTMRCALSDLPKGRATNIKKRINGRSLIVGDPPTKKKKSDQMRSSAIVPR